MITHLEPNILECEVKWTLGSITTNIASVGDRISGELFQILKDDAVKVLHSICQKIWKTQQWPQDWKQSVFIPIPKKGSAKKMFRLQHFQIFKLDLENAEEPNCQHPLDHRKSKRVPENIYFCFTDYVKDFDCVHFSSVQSLSYV